MHALRAALGLNRKVSTTLLFSSESITNLIEFSFLTSISTPLNGNYYSITEPSQQQFNKQNGTSRYNREMTLVNGDASDVTKQKEELVNRLTKQLVALTNDRTIITDQNTTNDLLGTDISSIVSKKLRPSEATKFRSYVDDVGHITMLLLSLSGRLARIENSLFSISDAAEKVSIFLVTFIRMKINLLITVCVETFGQQTSTLTGAIG